MKAQTFNELVRQRRVQMLVHSYLYYVLDQSIVSDDKWQQWADELTQLQARNNPEIGFYDEEFKDWNGNTGMHLPKDAWVVTNAKRLLEIHNRMTGVIDA